MNRSATGPEGDRASSGLLGPSVRTTVTVSSSQAKNKPHLTSIHDILANPTPNIQSREKIPIKTDTQVTEGKTVVRPKTKISVSEPVVHTKSIVQPIIPTFTKPQTYTLPHQVFHPETISNSYNQMMMPKPQQMPLRNHPFYPVPTISHIAQKTNDHVMPMLGRTENLPIPPPQFYQPQIVPIPLPRTVTRPTQPPQVKQFSPPKPVYFKDSSSSDYAIRCVCEEGHPNGLLVQCEKCEFWLHGVCVNIARASPSEPFICPFCSDRRIKCTCGKNRSYNYPLVKCKKCNSWVHKMCQSLDFGRIPDNFICTSCGGKQFKFPTIQFEIGDSVLNVLIPTDMINHDALNLIPDGHYKNLIEIDLSKSELDFRETISKFFCLFASIIFDRTSEFWKVFVESMSSLFNCEKKHVLDAVDELANKFLYSRLPPVIYPKTEFYHSESISEYLESNNTFARLDSIPESAKLDVRLDGGVFAYEAMEDKYFITELDGFILHADEVNSDSGIPKSILAITDTDLIIDLGGSKTDFISKIRRSFHFNTIVKPIRVDGKVKVALYATRLKGPLQDEKSRRGVAISEGGELFLPFDGYIPFSIESTEWKDKKARTRNTKPKENLVQQKKQKKQNNRKNNKKLENLPEITLLSAFTQDIIPYIGVKIIEDPETSSGHDSRIRTRYAAPKKYTYDDE